MPHSVPDGDGVDALLSANHTQRDRPSALQLVAALSSIPGIEQLAETAREQMLQASREANRTYPETNRLPVELSNGSATPAADLEALVLSGTRDVEETRRLGALAMFGVMRRWPESTDGVANLASQLFWLESESRLPALSLAVEVLDDARKSQLSVALSQLATDTSAASRGQKCLALMWSEALSGDLNCLQTLLDLSNGELASHSRRSFGSPSLGRQAICGRVLRTPRGPFITALAAFTGWMLLRHLMSCVSRYVLAYRAQAELRVSERGIEIHEQTTILGRRLRDRTRLLSLQMVRSLSREVRYARAGTYAGLAALAIGSFIGMRLFVDGIRAPGFSGPTMLIGLLLVLSGLGFDFAFTYWPKVSRSQCRLLIETDRGRGIYLTCDEPAKVDGMLVDLASRLPA